MRNGAWVALVVTALGWPAYVGLDALGWIPPPLRAAPWPLELAMGASAALAVWRSRRRRAAVVAIAATLIIGFSLSTRLLWHSLPASPRGLPLGAVSAAVSVRTLDGERAALGSFRGSPTVLLFFRGAG